jgi:hypothetical protein
LFGPNSAGATGTHYTQIVDVTGLDPRVSVACAFARRPPAGSTTLLPSAITAALSASTLVRLSTGAQALAPLPQALFANGGALDANHDDGCELVTAAYGVRFTVNAVRGGATAHSICLVVTVRPNVDLSAETFAAIVEGLAVSRPPVVQP